MGGRSEGAKAVLALRPGRKAQGREKVENERLREERDRIRAVCGEASRHLAAGRCERVVHPGQRRHTGRPPRLRPR